jgi:hypothetical protein
MASSRYRPIHHGFRTTLSFTSNFFETHTGEEQLPIRGPYQSAERLLFQVNTGTMSPTVVPTGGPYVKHHCKNFMTDDCPNWVYIANTACIECVVGSCNRVADDSC